MSGLPEGVVGVQGLYALDPADLQHLAWVVLHLRRSELEGEALASVLAQAALPLLALGAREVDRLRLEQSTAKCRALQEQLAATQEQANKIFDETTPHLEAGYTAIRKMKKIEIVELQDIVSLSCGPGRSRKLSAFVSDTLTLLCRLFGENETAAAMKQVISQPNFLQRLMAFDKDGVSDALLDGALQPYAADPQNDPAVLAESANRGREPWAAVRLSTWLHGMAKYAAAVRTSAPLRAELGELAAALREAQAERSSLQSVEDYCLLQTVVCRRQ
jgi:hypothetical protein